MEYIFFNPRGWFYEATNAGTGDLFSGNFNLNVGGRNININRNMVDPNSFFGPKRVESFYISDFDTEKLVEMIQIGDWGTNRVSIISEEFKLQPDTDYAFVFWLNGGENENGDEECQLHIEDVRQQSYPSVYKLNRSFIKPLLHYMGWELYQIPFHTAPSEQETVIRFRFVAKGAYLAIKPAAEPKAYKDIPDSPDPYAAYRPQRHNLVFDDGWPTINMYGGKYYSTEVVKRMFRESGEVNNQGDIKMYQRPEPIYTRSDDEEDWDDDDDDDDTDD